MAKRKIVKIHNKSDKPDNIVSKEYEIDRKSKSIEETLPTFLGGFFQYLRGNVLPMTRLAYLHDISFFCEYIIENTGLSSAKKNRDISLEEFNNIKAIDVNIFWIMPGNTKKKLQKQFISMKIVTRRWREKNHPFQLCLNTFTGMN